MTMMTQIDFGKKTNVPFEEIPISCCFEYKGQLYAKCTTNNAVALGSGDHSRSFSQYTEVLFVPKITIVRD